jgi:hypothetical protein
VFRSWWLGCSSLVGAWLVTLVAVGGAGAATVTVGSPLTATFEAGSCSERCTLGKVRGRRSRRVRVRRQSPRPGRVIPPGSMVSLKVGS